MGPTNPAEGRRGPTRRLVAGIIVGLVLFLIGAGIVFGWWFTSRSQPEQEAPEPAPVTAVTLPAHERTS